MASTAIVLPGHFLDNIFNSKAVFTFAKCYKEYDCTAIVSVLTLGNATQMGLLLFASAPLKEDMENTAIVTVRHFHDNTFNSEALFTFAKCGKEYDCDSDSVSAYLVFLG
jgi:hypothetical protein